MHFFNPADRMALVEVIKGQLTSAEVCKTIVDLSTSIGKTPVEVNEAPGFVVNRILIPMINEAAGILADGIASAEAKPLAVTKSATSITNTDFFIAISF